ncbi:MAG TPA: DUF1540 domain-containing protein [Clostridia bacterium]|nr:DUF1540 domain-containing protein [Clostridia bacterium]
MMEMQQIKECSVSDCAYNRDKICRALAITVGDSEPRCDTFWTYGNKAGDPSRLGSVGACKVVSCIHNYDGECGSPGGITVARKGNMPNCMTFTQR